MSKRIVMLGCFWVMLGHGGWGQTSAPPSDARWTTGALFGRARMFVLPKNEQRYDKDILGREWKIADEQRGNFTSFEGAGNLRVTADQGLRFSLENGKAVLGWGNYKGQQAAKDRVSLWKELELRVKVCQSTTSAVAWNLQAWSAGKPFKQRRGTDRSKYAAESKGTNLQNVVFSYRPQAREAVAPDGFRLEISGAPGAEVEIREFVIFRDFREASVRKEFVLPEGQVWRAIADVGGSARLYVNGQEILGQQTIQPRPFAGYRTEAVNLTPYLKPGPNCIGLQGAAVAGSPYLFLQGRATMVSGEQIPLDTDAGWKWSRTAGEGWNRAGYDDAAWSAIGTNKQQVHWETNTLYSYRRAFDRPAHDGLLAIRNPTDNLFYYSERLPAAFDVSVPAGLLSRNPRLEWSVAQWSAGQEKEIKRGQLELKERQGDSLVGRVDPGVLMRGVYLLSLRLLAGAEVLDEAPPEPFVVVRKMPMREVAGDSFEQGMDLKLEHTIDFTKPDDDDYPWMEVDGKGRAIANPKTQEEREILERQSIRDPIIVKRNGLRYRETRTFPGAQISYLVEFKHPGDFYVMVLEYPHDAERIMGFGCSAWSHGATPTVPKNTPGLHAGYRYPLSNEMREWRWLYRPDPGTHSLNLINLSREVPAAARRLRIYHIANGLPALNVPAIHTRWIGPLTERTAESSGFYPMFLSVPPPPEGLPKPVRFGAASSNALPVREMCRYLEECLDTCEAFAMYLRFAGMNLHAMGCYQYSDSNTPFTPPSAAGLARLAPDIRDVAARVFKENDIDFFASVEFGGASILKAAADRARTGVPPNGTFLLVNKDGQEAGPGPGTASPGWDFVHPEVYAAMLRLADDLALKFGPLSNFRGVNWTAYFGGGWIPSWRAGGIDQPLDAGYGDATLQRFEKDTGIKVPVDPADPERFQKRYAFLTGDQMRERWVQWRCEALAGFYSDVARHIRKQKSDLGCVATCFFYPHHALEFAKTGLPLQDYLRLWGWDPRRFHADPSVGLALSMTGILNRHGNFDRTGLGWDMNVLPEFHAAFGGTANRPVHIKHAWHEMEEFSWKMPARDKWPRPFQPTPDEQPDGVNTREAYVQALIGQDPQIFMYGFSDANLYSGNEQPLREFNRVLRRLPAERFQPVLETGFETTLAIRDLHQDGDYYFYVANPHFWPIQGTVAVAGAPEIRDLVTGQPAENSRLKDGTNSIALKLEPFGVAAFLAAAPSAQVVSWKTREVEDRYVAHVRRIADRAGELLTNSTVKLCLAADDLKYVEDTLQASRDYLARKDCPRAWLALTRDRFWILLHKDMEMAATQSLRDKDDGPVSTAPRSLAAPRADRPPAIDGVLNDKVWRKAKPVGGFIQPDKTPALATTKVYALRDDQNLYLGFVCRDRNPEEAGRIATEGKSVIQDDHIAIFLQPDPGTQAYYQLALSAGGAKMTQQVTGGARDYSCSLPWEAAVSKTKDAWIAEVKIPLAGLGGVKEGAAMGFNVGRGFRRGLVPISSWSYCPESWHAIDRFGRLTF